MAFWTDSNDPKQKYRFAILDSNEGVLDGESVWYWAKTVTKPSFEVSTGEYQLINHTFKYPALLTWNDISISMVDTSEITQRLLRKIFNFGYVYPNQSDIRSFVDGISKSQSSLYVDNLEIQQLNAEGEALEKWILNGGIITSINFGDLDYSSEDLVGLEMTIAYDWAELIEVATNPLLASEIGQENMSDDGGITDAFDPIADNPNPDVI
jgi:hypothetical protein